MTNTNTLTAETISLDQIRGLRAEAAQHDDIVQVVICDKSLDALTTDDDSCDANGQPDYSGGGHSPCDLERIRDVLYTWDRERCYQACAAAINAGQG